MLEQKSRTTLPYDIKSAVSIFDYSKGLLGKTLREFAWEGYKPNKGKGSLGQMVENLYFLLETNNYIIVPSSTIRQHVFPYIQIQNTTYSQTNLWSHQFSSSLTNTRANGWNARCHQDDDNIVVQRLALLSKLRASAPS